MAFLPAKNVSACAPLARRTVLKAGLAAAPAAALAGTEDPLVVPLIVSPPTTPFLEAMPIMPVLPARPLSDPAFVEPPTDVPNRALNWATGLPYEGRGEAHQCRSMCPPQYFYVQRFGAVPAVSIHPQLQPQINLWGANLGGGDLSVDKPMSPLPTIVSRYQAGANTAILVRRFNNLPTGVPSGGFGKNQITLHTHNFHSGPDSDGGPCDPRLGSTSEMPLTQGRFFFPGQCYDYYYNMKRARFMEPGMPDGDVRETLGTMWYHDHREGHTAENVYKGLAGFHIAFNEYDTGDENTGFKLPSFPQYDIPVIFSDVLIDPMTGQLHFDLFNTEGHVGDKYLVNGKVQPFFNVSKRRYRFRLLNKGPSRFYELYLTNPSNPSQRIPCWRIANDGNLYERPMQVNSMRMAVAERADIIIDFAKLTGPSGAAPGATRLWLENRMIQTNGSKPDGKIDVAGKPANVLLEFRIGAAALDASRDPATITSFAPITLPPIETPVITRVFDFGRSGGQWTLNDKPINCDEVRFAMKRGTTERWIYRNLSGGWQHPIHNHFVEGRIIRRGTLAVTSLNQEYGRKDVVRLGESEDVEFIVRVSDYLGVYPIHCHNVVHEDHGMMLLFAVDHQGDNKTTP